VLLTTNEDGHVVVKARGCGPLPCHVPARSIEVCGAARRRAALRGGRRDALGGRAPRPPAATTLYPVE